MGTKIVTVGLSAIKLLEWNDYRTQLQVTFLPTTQIPGNTGKLFVGIGLVPTPTAGDPNQQDSLAQSDKLTFTEAFPGDPAVPHNEIWGIASAGGQVVNVFEESYSPDRPPRAVPVHEVGLGPVRALPVLPIQPEATILPIGPPTPHAEAFVPIPPPPAPPGGRPTPPGGAQ